MGYLVFMWPNPVDEITARRLGAGFEITCIAWDISWPDAGAWIAVGMRDSVIQVLLLNANSQLQPIFAGQLENTVPKSITFTQRGNIYMIGLYDGKVIKMDATDGVILSEHCYDSVMYTLFFSLVQHSSHQDCRGCAAVSLKKELVVIDNATNGFTLYLLDRGDPIRYFVTEPQHVPVPKQVAFGEESKIIVGGSDNGSVYLFERRSGQMLAKLAHSKTGLVQTITVHDVGGHCIIASASPASGRKKSLIKVWTHQYTSNKLAARSEGRSMLRSTITIATFLLVLGLGLQTNLLGGVLIPRVTYWCSHLPVQKPAPVLTPPPRPLEEIVAGVGDMEILKELAIQLVGLAKVVHENKDERTSEDVVRDTWPSGHEETTGLVGNDHPDEVDSNLEKGVIIYL
ncbi:hypothetical protein M404DRAFT_29039 [Pisolithus tinctorius Marx 270]|uniref:Anaphase-promoting complex subunit 4 WD40 domain-containing protein n=1 Tax=Pisolithus tinctorius Marx 270 TaxID=870435 RepID=A0A0C3P0Q0_PISTI|nr:hypothetical protein M404DRAFT_29039 [Pisolithus tinctorius Marx 270]